MQFGRTFKYSLEYTLWRMPNLHSKAVAGGLKGPVAPGSPAVQAPNGWGDDLEYVRAAAGRVPDPDLRAALVSLTSLGGPTSCCRAWDAAYAMSRIASYMRTHAQTAEDRAAWDGVYHAAGRVLDRFARAWEAGEVGP